MSTGLSSGDAGRDLVIVAVTGVQRFIGEARSTADVRAGSEIVARLALSVAGVFAGPDAELVFPSVASGTSGGPPGRSGLAGVEDAGSGMPNRVAALVTAGAGEEVARRAVAAAQRAWDGWVRDTLSEFADTPGFPAVQWVCVPAGADGYAGQWERARTLMDARRRIRDFAPQQWAGRVLCSLSPRWPAGPGPVKLRPYQQDTLSAANWVKRRWRQTRNLTGFASTSSIASAAFRRDVLGCLDDQRVRGAVGRLAEAARQLADEQETAVPGLPEGEDELGRWLERSAGPWVYRDRWQAEPLARQCGLDVGAIRPAVGQGSEAASDLVRLMQEWGTRPPASHLAVLVQDVNRMGLFLSGQAPDAAGRELAVSADAHRRVSDRLREIARRQMSVLQRGDVHGVPVYAGGDDLLAFAPAASALRAAADCQELIGDDLPTASTAVLFFHHRAGLQPAITQARDMLDDAKAAAPGRPVLAAGFHRRSGAGGHTVQRWSADDGRSAADLLGLFTVNADCELSPRLVGDLERDRAELAGLQERDRDLYRAELGRLVRRHVRMPAGAPPDASGRAVDRAASAAADALEWLGSGELSPHEPGGAGPRPALAARVGVFLRQEAR